jgi:hypothetical protein
MQCFMVLDIYMTIPGIAVIRTGKYRLGRMTIRIGRLESVDN